MKTLRGKYVEGRKAYVLRKPAIPGETEALYIFGWPETLADRLLMWLGKEKDERTPDELAATLEALTDPAIDVSGYRLLVADRALVAQEAAGLLDLEDLDIQYPGKSDDEYQIREYCARIRDAGILHDWLDAMTTYDKDLDAPGLVEQIHRQIDEAGE